MRTAPSLCWCLIVGVCGRLVNRVWRVRFRCHVEGAFSRNRAASKLWESLCAQSSSACSPEVAAWTTSSPSRSASASFDFGCVTNALVTLSSPCVSFANSIRSLSYWGDKCPVASRRTKYWGNSVVGLAGLFTLGAPQETCHAGSGPVRGILVSSLVVKCEKRDNFSRGRTRDDVYLQQRLLLSANAIWRDPAETIRPALHGAAVRLMNWLINPPTTKRYSTFLSARASVERPKAHAGFVSTES